MIRKSRPMRQWDEWVPVGDGLDIGRKHRVEKSKAECYCEYELLDTVAFDLMGQL